MKSAGSKASALSFSLTEVSESFSGHYYIAVTQRQIQQKQNLSVNGSSNRLTITLTVFMSKYFTSKNIPSTAP